MKKLLYLLTALILFQCGTMTKFFKADSGIEDIEVAPQFQERLKELDSIYKKNNIKIDYSRISSIMPMDSLKRDSSDTRVLEGLYNRETLQIHINPDQMNYFFSGKYEKIITVILAHEIAHSQGKEHSSDENSIMYPSSKFMPKLISECTIEELVTDIYLQDYPIYVEKLPCLFCGETH